MLATYKKNNYGDTSACFYYSEMMQENQNCNYYKEGLGICRGENAIVNLAVDTGYMHAKIFNNLSTSLGETPTSIRSSLILPDQQARANEEIDQNGCAKGNVIDQYHNKAFSEAGINDFFYGGNLWLQSTWPNPAPLDPSKSKYDIRWLWSK
ncbi:hypothetical protein [Lampropedia aestuarii]|uniref:hypothetical protein n=1 Tax=Lampropedia aestuarii TaxID=2562762 RepID=UPI002468459A|nr:hypothetical protein [Lampropedia aestuarii]MDH5858559.1 hypothetical protein [Lampropedia aestuarii]